MGVTTKKKGGIKGRRRVRDMVSLTLQYRLRAAAAQSLSRRGPGVAEREGGGARRGAAGGAAIRGRYWRIYARPRVV